MLEKNLNSTNSSKEENWCNENNDFPNTRVGVSKSVSPISIRPSWVNVVEKSLRVDHIEQTGEIVGAGLDPIEERVTKDISAMGFERHNTHLEEGGSKVEARELLGSDAGLLDYDPQGQKENKNPINQTGAQNFPLGDSEGARNLFDLPEFQNTTKSEKKEKKERPTEERRQLRESIIRVLSWNVRGLESETKKTTIQKTLKIHRVEMVLLQETYKELIIENDVGYIWHDDEFHFLVAVSFGKSGGVLTIWDKNKFKMESYIVKSRYVLLSGLWLLDRVISNWVNVYGFCDVANQVVLWD
ncbi:hypothetical protein V6N11_046765 [Hibiscus sabdariffa]|uniref:Uncharacterized protein n=1 Tax=Hibiscus sabdariffa TaxID=183260 RepID=A0ABR1ZAL3_9ROSI